MSPAMNDQGWMTRQEREAARDALAAWFRSQDIWPWDALLVMAMLSGMIVQATDEVLEAGGSK